MSLFDAQGHTRVPAQAREVFDVTGAGDTVIATLAAMLACGMTLRDAMPIANRAGSIVVGKFGTASVGYEELFDMKVVVTGAAGMIGSNLVHGLNAIGIDDIIAVDDLTDGPKYRNLLGARISRLLRQGRVLRPLRAAASSAASTRCCTRAPAPTRWSTTAASCWTRTTAAPRTCSTPARTRARGCCTPRRRRPTAAARRSARSASSSGR